MAKSRWHGEWIFIQCFGDDAFTKAKIVSQFKEFGTRWLKMQAEDGHVFNIPADSVSSVGEMKKAKVLNLKNKLRLVK